jgi:hypothetical protein
VHHSPGIWSVVVVVVVVVVVYAMMIELTFSIAAASGREAMKRKKKMKKGNQIPQKTHFPTGHCRVVKSACAFLRAKIHY